jgi:hypothetical protein
LEGAKFKKKYHILIVIVLYILHICIVYIVYIVNVVVQELIYWVHKKRRSLINTNKVGLNRYMIKKKLYFYFAVK